MTKPLLEVRNLVKHFPVRGGGFSFVRQQLKAVDDVSFTLLPGQTLGLVGESGCGKSTLGRALLRLQEPNSGQVFFEGRDILQMNRAELKAQRRDMQMIFQDPFASLSPRRTVAQTVREPLDVHDIGTSLERRKRVEELIELVGLRAAILNRYPHEFSGGQRQRIGIARALALNPKLIVADEPVSALDVSVQSQVLNLIKDLQLQLGVSFVFISHDLAVIQHISDVVAVMYLGRIVEQAEVSSLYASPKHPYTQALLSAVPAAHPAAGAKRIILSGDVPSPISPPSGCTFHPRCPAAQAKCQTTEPRQTTLHNGDYQRQFTCHYPLGS
jgi:oligopeptide transport system ATP-binding protein